MKIKPCIIGLGYVGLPLFVRLQKKFQTVGFDVNKKRVKNLRNGQDTNGEYEKKELKILNSSL